MHRHRQHIETLAGRGYVSLDGVTLGEVTYHIDIWQQVVTAGHHEMLPGTRQIAGHITDHDLEPSALFDRVVRLHLERGGHLDCLIEHDRVKAPGVLMRAGPG